MKNLFFIPIVIAAASLTSCKKSDKTPEPPKEFIQLQKFNFGEGSLNLLYNEQHLISRAEIHAVVDEAGTSRMDSYVSWSYQDGFPVKAEFFNNNGTAFIKTYEFHYKADAGNKIAYVARLRLNEDGSIRRKDTTNYSFGANNKLISTKVRTNDAAAITFGYDNNGNHIRENVSSRSENTIYEDRFEFQYDNKINPLSVNGLGLMLYTIFGDDHFEMTQILSTNNITTSKYLYSVKRVDEGDQPVSTTLYKTDKVYTNTFDETGGLKQVSIKTTTESSENGTVFDTGNWESVFKYTCIKKQQ
ncbi:MAG: hypothetical protein ACTHMC_05585 [Pseudobacter sp.]|uniref:hypothetical protein n=1 Tax=Pseudobacter sp. TaxID=2045420 RepID=UPI003F80EDD5